MFLANPSVGVEGSLLLFLANNATLTPSIGGKGIGLFPSGNFTSSGISCGGECTVLQVIMVAMSSPSASLMPLLFVKVVAAVVRHLSKDVVALSEERRF